MIPPESLADRLHSASIAVRSQGPLTWERVDAWETARMPRQWEPGDEEEDERQRMGRSDKQDDEFREDAAAARYKSELRKITVQIGKDLARLEQILSICNPPPLRTLASKEKQAAQVGADGFCVSCYRNDGHLKEYELRLTKAPVPSKPYYRDLCRFCGSFKAEHGTLPPVPLLRLHHRSKTITEADVAAALGRVSA